MGFFSKIGHAFRSVGKAIKKGVKKVEHDTSTVFHKAWSVGKTISHASVKLGQGLYHGVSKVGGSLVDITSGFGKVLNYLPWIAAGIGGVYLVSVLKK